MFFILPRFFFKQGFTQRITMENHISGVHEKKKPFACAYCDYHCAYQGNLNTHIQTVHEKRRPHKCEKCEYSCTQKSVLKRHVQSVHEKAAGGVQAAAAQQQAVAAAAANQKAEILRKVVRGAMSCKCCYEAVGVDVVAVAVAIE